MFAAPFLFATDEANPLLGSWHFTGFENEVNSNPKPAFFFDALPFKTVEISEPSAGTLRLVLKRANGSILETVERPFTRDGDFFENINSEDDTDGRERQRLGLRVIRDGLVLAQDIGAWFATDDTNIWDAWGFAGVLTKTPLPKTNAALWAGPYAGTEWIYSTDYNDESGTHFLADETGSLSFTLDKVGSGYRFTADYASEEETDTGTAKVAGSYLAADWQESGGIIWQTEDSVGTLLNARGHNRVVQVSDRELVILGVSGDVSRIAPKAGNTGFQAYNAIDYADSAVVYLHSTATFVREGQAVSLAAPDSEIAGPFTAKGLPAGLVIDPATGAIDGNANVKPGNYAITRTATGFTDTVYLRVEAFPSALLANPDSPSKLVYNEYEILLHPPSGNNAPVGKVTLKLAASGLFSGTLVTGSPKSDALKGRFVPYYDGSAYYALATLPLPGGRTLGLRLDADSLGAELSDANGMTLGAYEAGDFSGRVRLYTAASPAPGGAAKGTVPYTLEFSLDSEPGSAPVGHGWATATINTAGALSLTGKLADGRTLTGTLRATSAGYLPYLKPYDKLPDAYLAGRLRLSVRDGNLHYINSGDGLLTWSKPAPLSTSDRVPAFGPVTVSTRLESWTKIVTTEEFATRLGVTGPAIAVIIDGGFAETDPSRVLPARLGFTVNKGKLITSVASPVLVEGSTAAAITANTKAWAKIWKLSVDLSKGTFTGEFHLTDSVSAGTVANPDFRENVSRKVPFSGVLANGGGWPFAYGHYVVPSLEKNGPILCGRIALSATSD